MPITSQDRLFKWGPIEFRLFYGAWWNNIFLEVRNHYPWPWPDHALIFESGRMVYVTDKKQLYDTGEKYFSRYFLNIKNYKRHWQLWLNWVVHFEALREAFAGQQFSKVSDSELLRLFKLLHDTIIDFWLIVHVPEIANWGGEAVLHRLLNKIDRRRSDEYLEILSALVKPSFFQEEEIELLHLARSPRSRWPSLLKAHAQKYHWLLNSYGGDRVLKADYFRRKLKELTQGTTPARKIASIKKQLRQRRQRKLILAKKLRLNKKTILAADQLTQSIWWQDQRKGYIWRYQALLDRISKEVARRRQKNFHDLLWYWPKEMMRLIARQPVDFKKINARKKVYAVVYRRGYYREYYGRAARRLQLQYTESQNADTREVSGLVVSRQRGAALVRGIAKIINNPFRDGRKMKAGDILVAGMTSPEFVILMKKAAAIVTDHGGITSHATVVSRELGLPCIVGTKIATRVFKDGDLVEVDTGNGIVHKVQP